eukprot:CAMPEP_0175134938 /NCGR_PEP_ID=MMETSP0087-20121206/8446_1 /TAXON_ID=136419 /ORGANISM="Unknown Unknown, Strain D1" /LENGTH=212 /DNA_ID=CAMNT_0016417535 /DNA_START=39 /DNA_END=677 /DNA_ORIENTATION=-
MKEKRQEGGCDSSSFETVGDMFPDSKPAPGQRLPLSTQKTVSCIPKAPPSDGSEQKDSHWVFPSPQRFYNAMKKKGWHPNEQDMAAIVSIHNTVNEQCWREVLKYESFHSNCESPKLSRFRGRPADFSVKARIKSFFGSKLPFDRHDWVVDRCGTEVKYIIDFYEGDASTGSTEHGSDAAPSIFLDVRPAPSFGGFFDRARMGVYDMLGLWR